MNLEWQVLHIRTGSEASVSKVLQQGMLETYTPFVMRSSDGIVFVEEPLLPGYIFVRIDDALRRISHIGVMSKVIGWVKFGGVVAVLSDYIVQQFKAKVQAINAGGGLSKSFLSGEPVRVQIGSMDDFGYLLETITIPKAKVRILLKFMGEMVPAEVPFSSLELRSPDEKLNLGIARPRRTRGRGRKIKSNHILPV